MLNSHAHKCMWLHFLSGARCSFFFFWAVGLRFSPFNVNWETQIRIIITLSFLYRHRQITLSHRQIPLMCNSVLSRANCPLDTSFVSPFPTGNCRNVSLFGHFLKIAKIRWDVLINVFYHFLSSFPSNFLVNLNFFLWFFQELFWRGTYFSITLAIKDFKFMA